MTGATLQDAQRLHREGRILDAARLYRQILQADPNQTEAGQGLGIIYLRTGQFELAERAFAEVQRLKPSAEICCARGEALLHLRRFEDALGSFDDAFAITPGFAAALNGRAIALLELRRLEEALAAFDALLAAEPNIPGAWSNRGNALVAMRRFGEAVASYDRALALMPDLAEARDNRAFALDCQNRAPPVAQDDPEALTYRALSHLAQKRFDEALADADAVLARDPGNAMNWNSRGSALLGLKHFDGALASFERALELRPDFPEARDNRDTALFALGRLNRCPPGYMRALFDDYSARYDESMVGELGYRGHVHLRALAERVLPRLTPPWRILDLGSGTGLVGESFKDLAAGGRLDGIDLSPRMIETARTRGIYDDLVLGDLEAVLAQDGSRYDLVLAADTMIYLGDLGPTFAGVFRRLEPSGFYIFAVEAKAGDGWEQTHANRFRHSESYLREEAARTGLDFVALTECVLRREAAEPVAGFTVALRKAG